MQSKNKTRIENIEESQGATKMSSVAVQWVDEDEGIIQHNGKEYSVKEFKKLYPNATILKVEWID